MMNELNISFFHGLGDCVHFCHSIPLWNRRGFDVRVHCHHEKECLFRWAGCEIVPRGKDHTWLHPPSPGVPTWRDHWAGNKAAWNLTHSGVMPDIGHYSDLWQEFLDIKLKPFVPLSQQEKVKSFISGLKHPIVCIHTKGDHVPERKDYPDDKTHDLYKLLLDAGYTVLILDWSNHSPRFNHPNIRHMVKDYGFMSLSELYCLLTNADCLIGIDSGPVHFARFTEVPVVAIWHFHHPSHYILPRPQTINILAHSQHDVTERRRIPYNLIEADNERMPKPELIADVATSVISHGVARTMLKRILPSSWITPTSNTISGAENAYFFGVWLKCHGQSGYVLDNDPAKVQVARKRCQELPIQVDLKL